LTQIIKIYKQIVEKHFRSSNPVLDVKIQVKIYIHQCDLMYKCVICKPLLEDVLTFFVKITRNIECRKINVYFLIFSINSAITKLTDVYHINTQVYLICRLNKVTVTHPRRCLSFVLDMTKYGFLCSHS